MVASTRLPAILSVCFSLLSTLAGPAAGVDNTIRDVHILKNVGRTTSQPQIRSPVATTPGSLRIKENSGVCEDTPGVYQASGYGDISANKSVFFWFFEARKNPENAPLVLYLDGGPGASSIGSLIVENGPCHIDFTNNTVVHNPYSWNNNANILYIDQPIGVGFSHGTIDITTSQRAAEDTWEFMQIWLKDSRFSKYQQLDFAIWTISYGGHYGPVFSKHFLSQNDAIGAGSVSGVKLNLKTLGIGVPITDSLIQYPGYIAYAAGANPYHPLVSSDVLEKGNTSWTKERGCRDQITKCNKEGSDSVCAPAWSYCQENILLPLAGNYNVYDVRITTNSTSTSNTSEPDPITDWVTSVHDKIGAEVPWAEVSLAVNFKFRTTGDSVRNARPDLEDVIKAGVRTLVYSGDADYICNHIGVEAMVDALQTQFTDEYHRQSWAPYNVTGKTAGQYKQAGSFSYLRVFGAGHAVSITKYGGLEFGQALFQLFDQFVNGHSLSST